MGWGFGLGWEAHRVETRRVEGPLVPVRDTGLVAIEWPSNGCTRAMGCTMKNWLRVGLHLDGERRQQHESEPSALRVLRGLM